MEKFDEHMERLIESKAQELSKLSKEDLILTVLSDIAGYLVEREHYDKTGTNNALLAASCRAIQLKLMYG